MGVAKDHGEGVAAARASRRKPDVWRKIAGRERRKVSRAQRDPPNAIGEAMGAFIPAGAEWYVADLVEEIRVEGDPRSVVHINTVLVNARSPDEAFSRAWQLGQRSEQEY